MPKTRFIRRTCAIFASAGLSLCGLSSWAQSDADNGFEGWYQVELIVFERLNSNSEEIWPNNISLHYPLNLALLSKTKVTSDTEAGLETEIEKQTENHSDSPLDANLGTPLSINTETAELEVNTPKTPSYATLSEDQRQLNNAAKRLARSNNYHILFHEAWRQPVSNYKQSQSVAISGGEQYDQHFELEGSIKISVNRYLHLETNLWRTYFATNYGQETGYWPALPAVPSAQTSSNIEGPLDGSNFDLDSLNLRNSLNLEPDAAETSNPFAFSDLQLQSSELRDFEEIGSRAYVVDEIITLRQKRRMRSEETHYIDHPKLGILIRIVKWDDAESDDTEPSAEANAEGSSLN